MPNEWVVLELSPKAEGEDPDFIRQSIRHMIRDAEVYLPVSVTKVGEDRVINYLVDGYAFIKRAHPDEKYYRLEGSRYVQTVITKIDRSGGRAMRKLACATDEDIARFKSQIHAEEDQGICVGDTVVVTSGPYRQIKAFVIEDIPENDTVQIHVKLRSKESIVTLPRSFLRLVEKAPRTSYRPRVVALKEWLAKFRPITAFDDTLITRIQDRFKVYDQLEGFVGRGRSLHASVRVADAPPMDARPVARAFVSFHRLHAWHDRGMALFGGIRALEKPLDPKPMLERLKGLELLHRCSTQMQEIRPLLAQVAPDALEQVYLRWSWIDDIIGRFSALCADVATIEKKLEGKNMTDHLVIDGHNLAIRCATVPGLDSLKDSQGRPTGAIVGFLRSLGSFQKKFPGAKITVVWDGSSQRRRKQYEGYKANRNVLRDYFEIEFLKELLPLLGVEQVWNATEEADDVIATLLRGPFKGQSNVVITTDRDMLQLVTESDRVFIPAVGAGKEKLYDIDTVEKDYGVRPEKMVHLRAIDGDTSDNIPGAPGFGLKMASRLLKLYGTVDGIFASNLAGLTPNQYQKLRGAEKQVKLNVTLMSLYDVPLVFVSPNPDQIVATQRLQNVDVKAETILPVFFPATV